MVLDRYDFSAFVLRICQIFERKTPSDAVMDTWYEEVRWIPNELLCDIANRFKTEEAWPRNFTAKVKAIYMAIRPRSDVWETPRGCRECSHGSIHVVKDAHNYVFRCANCNTDPRTGIPAKSIRDLLGLGYAPHWTMGTIKQIKSMPHYGMGREALPRMLRETIDRVGLTQIAGDWDNQF